MPDNRKELLENPSIFITPDFNVKFTSTLQIWHIDWQNIIIDK